MRCNSLVFGLFLALCLDVTCPSPWREAVNENDNPSGLKDNTAMDDIIRANKNDHTAKEVKGDFEADIILTESDSEGVDTKDFSSKDTADVDVDSVVSKRKTIRSRRNLWVTKSVPVELERSAAGAWTNILAAIREIEKKSCVRFRMREKDDDYWIRIVNKSGCYSPVGRQYDKPGKGQELSIGKGCNHTGVIMHEFLHALGFWHEQARTDRSKYLEVRWENVEPGQTHNFNRYREKQMDYAGAPYDYNSIMHYGNYAFSKNKKPTMLAIMNPFLQFGQITKMSDNDIRQLNNAYDCKSDKSRGWSSWGNWGPCDTKCARERERFCSAEDLKKCPGATKRDRIQVDKGKCPPKECYAPIEGHWGRWGPWSKCSRTCGQGYMTKSRTCDEPKPLYGGRFCFGSFVEVSPCQEKRTCGGW